MWEHFAHGSDIGVRGRGATRSEAFAEKGATMTTLRVAHEPTWLAQTVIDV